MGSFAYSMHVRAAGSRAIAHGLEHLLPTRGYDLHQTGRRKVWIAEARNGWVGLLLSSLEDSVDLAGPLSAELQTDVLHVLVNDSDSWHYQTFRNGVAVDDFDSLGEMNSAGELRPTAQVEHLIRGGGAEALGQALGERLRGMMKNLDDWMPPEIREIQRKFQRGAASPEETDKYFHWAKTESPRRVADYMRAGGFEFGPLGSPPNAEALRGHVERLRSFLSPSAYEEQVRAILGEQGAFAEETLARFLPLVGVASVYAHLSYRYLDEFSKDELVKQGVRLVKHLRFQKRRRRS
ncbi:MAG: hypothetical protein L0215_27040 [Gemmataceae bacterium]|nr:hypothetical protein [Gemmataceae bacterium]